MNTASFRLSRIPVLTVEPAGHAAYLAREWRGDPSDLAAHRDIFLPEDFRALRRCLHALARGNRDPGSSQQSHF